MPFERVLYALGIRFVGKVAARVLARHFGSMQALMQASADDLTLVDGIGSVIAQSVITFLHDEANRTLIARLEAAGVQMQNHITPQTANGPLNGLSIVISGTFSKHTREEYKALIEQNGGKNVGSISRKTNFILAGDNMGPSKLEKARLLNIPLLTEDEFLNKLHGAASEPPTQSGTPHDSIT